MLAEQELAHFRTFGFIVLRRAFAPDEMTRISLQFDRVMNQDRRGQPFSGETRHCVVGCVEQNEELRRLLDDDRIYLRVEQLLGPGFLWITSDGNLYVGDTRWHPDRRDLSDQMLKIAFYLDPVDRDTGCLRVIPGSHLPGLGQRLRDQWPAEEATESPYGVSGSSIPHYAVRSEPGDVVFFDQRLFHSSFGGKSGRRMFTLNFVAKPRSMNEYDVIRKMYEGNVELANRLGLTARERIFNEDFLGSGSPRIQHMVGELVTMGLR